MSNNDPDWLIKFRNQEMRERLLSRELERMRPRNTRLIRADELSPGDWIVRHNGSPSEQVYSVTEIADEIANEVDELKVRELRVTVRLATNELQDRLYWSDEKVTIEQH